MKIFSFSLLSSVSKLLLRKRIDKIPIAKFTKIMSAESTEVKSSLTAESIATHSVPKEGRGKRARKRKRRNRPENQEDSSEAGSIPMAHPQKKVKFFNEDMYNETSYYMENGLRKVHPYHYTFSTHCKGRWLGLKLHEIFKREFRSESPEYYEAAINCGMVTVNGAKASLDYVMKNNDFLCSRVHRHEPPVTAQPIDIIENNEDIVVINKPASIPVHPSGRYRHNTIIFLLGKVHGLKNLHTIHRLDRLTSGLLMFARTLEMSQKMDFLVRERQLQKTYVSRVKGEFPSDPVECSEPIQTMSHKIGVCRVSEKGKPCKTEFQRLSYNGTSSLVKCTPHTGRMHQIRVHLQYLGYPILNDPLYNCPVWGPDTGKGGMVDKTDDEILASLIEHHNRENQESLLEDNTDEISKTVNQTNTKEDTNSQTSQETDIVTREKEVNNEQTCQEKTEKDLPSSDGQKDGGTEETSSAEKHANSLEELNKKSIHTEAIEGSITVDDCHPANEVIDAMCKECRLKHKDPLPHELVMYLHALSYKGPDFEYKTPMPDWASDDWQEPHGIM